MDFRKKKMCLNVEGLFFILIYSMRCFNWCTQTNTHHSRTHIHTETERESESASDRAVLCIHVVNKNVCIACWDIHTKKYSGGHEIWVKISKNAAGGWQLLSKMLVGKELRASKDVVILKTSRNTVSSKIDTFAKTQQKTTILQIELLLTVQTRFVTGHFLSSTFSIINQHFKSI